MALNDEDTRWLGRCVELARQALRAGDEPFHCPMCAAAHAWVGLGRIAFAVSGAQLAQWLIEWGPPLPPVASLAVTAVGPHLVPDGPAPEYSDEMMAPYAATFRP